ncbi:MAG TPA: phosphatidate cytidylyltransferase [Pelagibacteraceae bacterium]|nr:phosphatidate cytidylyltransferase [Pelagibacteraceae bacterium]
MSIVIVSGIVFSEIANLIRLVEKSTSIKNWVPFRLISFFYIFLLFLPIAVFFYRLGAVFIIYILLICIFSDIGGYVIGKTIGGKKLTKISPNKTISGSIGSFCFSIAPLLLFYNFDPSKYFHTFNNFLLCLEISLVCQLGDIFISYIKRKAKVKNTGNLLPGHGGLLDRIDGIIFAVPFVWIHANGLSAYFEMLKNSFSVV